MDGFCNQNADQLGYLAGPSLLTVYVERRFRLLMRTRHGHLQEQKTLGSRLGSLY